MILDKLRFVIQKEVQKQKKANKDVDSRDVATQLFLNHFKVSDTTDGLLRQENLATGLKNLGIPIADGDISRLMQVLDTDADATLSQEEFVSATLRGIAPKAPANVPANVPASPGPAAPIQHGTPNKAPPTPGAMLAVPTSQRHPRSLVISPENVALADSLFDLLDTNSDGRLDRKDFVDTTNFNMTDMEKQFHGT